MADSMVSTLIADGKIDEEHLLVFDFLDQSML